MSDKAEAIKKMIEMQKKDKEVNQQSGKCTLLKDLLSMILDNYYYCIHQ